MKRSSAIRLIGKSLIIKNEGEKLNDVPEGVGAESPQLTAQHKRANDASLLCSLLLAFDNISSFGCSHFPNEEAFPPAHRSQVPESEKELSAIFSFFAQEN